MTTYNLLRNGYVTSSTSSGTGTLDLTKDQLRLLYDENTTTSGITISPEDTLYIDVDLLNRVRISEFSVYMDIVGDRLTALSNMSFYYKNYATDEYTLASAAATTEKFITTDNPTLFAPRYARFVVTNVSGTLYEVYMPNDTTYLTFGEDGTATEEQLDESADYDTVYIYNNSDTVATAYVTPDFDSGDLAPYLSLATSPTGTYRNIKDSSVGINNAGSPEYTWDQGSFDGTMLKNDTLIICPPNDTEILNYNPMTILDLPFTQSSYGGWGVGYNCWDLGPNNIVYAIGCGTDTPSSVYLYKFSEEDASWEYIDELASSLDDAEWACMSIIDNYVYLLLDTSGTFGRYNLNGSIGNWEDLTTCPHGTITKAAQGLCSDKSRYLYSSMITYSEDTTSFQRYDTVSGTWTSMNADYDYNNSTSYTQDSHLTLNYDVNRDVIYMDCGEYSYNDDYIQRYIVSTDTWDTEWFEISEDPRGRSFGYYDDYLVYGCYGDGYFIYSKNLITQTSVPLELPFTQATTSMTRLSFICYPKSNGLVGVLVTGGSASVIYSFTLGQGRATSVVAKYTSPILTASDAYAPAYLFVTYLELADGCDLTYGGYENEHSILIRGGDTAPEVFNKFYTTYEPTSTTFYLVSADMTTGKLTNEFDVLDLDTTYLAYKTIYRVMHCAYDNTLVLHVVNTYSTDTGAFYRYSLIDKEFTYISNYSTSYLSEVQHTRHMGLDVEGDVWVYTGSQLVMLQYELGGTAVSITSDTSDFIHSIAPSRLAPTCWYTDKAEYKLIQVDADGDEICSVSLSSPEYLCATKDGGCLVYDSIDYSITYYDADGTEGDSFTISSSIDVSEMVLDEATTDSIFIWILSSDGMVRRINMSGTTLYSTTITNASNLVAFYDGCLVTCIDFNLTYQLDRECNTVKKWTMTAYDSLSIASCPVYLEYSNLISTQTQDLFDYVEDSIWGESADNWAEVSLKDNYLPAKAYYQVKLQLTSTAYKKTPEIQNVLVASAIKVSDIYPQKAKPVYLKTTFPIGLDNKEYTTKLKCWWLKKDDN